MRRKTGRPARLRQGGRARRECPCHGHGAHGRAERPIRNEAPGTAGFLEWGDEFVSLLDSPRLLPYLAFTLDASSGEPPVHRHGTGIRLDRMYGIEMSAGPTAEGGFHQVSSLLS